MDKPVSGRDGYWIRGVRQDKNQKPLHFRFNSPPQETKQYLHERKQLSSSFPTRHFFCDYCGEHFRGCCPTEYVVECSDPARCAFDKEMEL